VEFVAKKHGLLYRQAWLSEVSKQESVKWTLENLRKLLRRRAKARLSEGGGGSGDLSEHARR
jgi:hypothetical protein